MKNIGKRNWALLAA